MDSNAIPMIRWTLRPGELYRYSSQAGAAPARETTEWQGLGLRFQGWAGNLGKRPLGLTAIPDALVVTRKVHKQPTNRDMKAVSNAYPTFLPISAVFRIAATQRRAASNHDIPVQGHQKQTRSGQIIILCQS